METTSETKCYWESVTWGTYCRKEYVRSACLWAWQALRREAVVEVYMSDLLHQVRNWQRLPAIPAALVEEYAAEYLKGLGCTVADGSVRLAQGGAS